MKKALCLMIVLCSFRVMFAQTKYYSEEEKYRRLARDVTLRVNSPLILSDAIVFFYRGEAGKVVVAGDFNDWQAVLLMQQERSNFQKLEWSKRLKKGRYKYKLLVDDIWMEDPFNTNYTIDNAGQRVSYFDLEQDFVPNRRYPLHLENNQFAFRYTHPTARRVSLVGDFNNWNPFSLPMKFAGEGNFDVTIELKPGFHTYCFVVDDEWVADPYNLNQFSDETGSVVNVILVEGPLTPYEMKK